MMKVLIFIMLKILEVAPLFLIGNLIAKIFIFLITSILPEQLAVIILLITASVLIVFFIWLIYMSIKERVWQEMIKQNWHWANNIANKIINKRFRK